MSKRRKILSLILPFVFAMAMLIGMTVTAAALSSVPYMAWDETSQTVKAVKDGCTDYTEITNQTSWGTADQATWYVLKESKTISDRITVSGTVNLILCDGATLIASKGITVANSDTLNIYPGNTSSDVRGSGKLYVGTTDGTYATCDIGCAGIGGLGNDMGGDSCGTVIIHGGNVNATGGNMAAGIGGGNTGDGGIVTIYGGTIEAKGKADIGLGYGGAGIGGGSVGDGASVTIKGGTVTATGGSYSAHGIGGGSESKYKPKDGSLALGKGVSLYGGDSEPPELLDKGPKDYNGTRYKIMKTEFTQMFTVTFVDGQGNTLKTEVVESGQSATAPPDPTRDGYTFKGWDKVFSKVNEDMTVTALWEKKADPTPTPTPTPTTAKVTTVTVNSKTVSAKTLDAAIAKAGGDSDSVITITLGKNVKKISKGTFKNCKNSKTLIVKSKKLKKATVKNSLKGSKITKVKVKVGNNKTNKSYVNRYKKIFTKKNAGKKVKVTL